LEVVVVVGFEDSLEVVEVDIKEAVLEEDLEDLLEVVVVVGFEDSLEVVEVDIKEAVLEEDLEDLLEVVVKEEDC
jgi:DNA-binding protein YbaB